MSVSMIVILMLLVLAVSFLAVGTLRGSFRFWLVGYALVVVGLIAVYAHIHATQAPAQVREAPQGRVSS